MRTAAHSTTQLQEDPDYVRQKIGEDRACAVSVSVSVSTLHDSPEYFNMLESMTSNYNTTCTSISQKFVEAV